MQQVSEDHLRAPGDALANLRNDSPLSNYINADRPFVLQSRIVTQKLPCIWLVATDGCYGYLPTPMHFEHILLEALMQSRDPATWRERLLVSLRAVTGDDASLALVALGWESYQALKKAFAERYVAVQKQYIRPFTVLAQEQAQLAARKAALPEALWQSYRRGYELWLPDRNGREAEQPTVHTIEQE